MQVKKSGQQDKEGFWGGFQEEVEPEAGWLSTRESFVGSGPTLPALRCSQQQEAATGFWTGTKCNRIGMVCCLLKNRSGSENQAGGWQLSRGPRGWFQIIWLGHNICRTWRLCVEREQKASDRGKGMSLMLVSVPRLALGDWAEFMFLGRFRKPWYG